jgi:hypothetical protein
MSSWCNDPWKHHDEGRDAARWGERYDHDHRERMDNARYGSPDSCDSAYAEGYRYEIRRQEERRAEEAAQEQAERRAYERRQEAEREEYEAECYRQEQYAAEDLARAEQAQEPSSEDKHQ